jgi:hypothetical protein
MLTVTKGIEEKTTLGLSSLVIKGIDLLDVFKTDVYEYSINVEQDVTSLEIEAIANEEGATVEITGNEDLQDGENVVTILVKSADGENVVTYQITVNKGKEAEAVGETTNTINIVLIIVIVAAILLVILIIILLIKNHKQKEMDESGYDSDEEDTDWMSSNNNNDDNSHSYFEDHMMNDNNGDDDDEDEDDRPRRGRGKHF